MCHQIEFRAMGCQIFAAIDSPSPPESLAALPQLFEQWENHLSRFRPDSELNRINRAKGARNTVSPVFADVLDCAIAAEKLSGGLVTPLLLDALLSAGYDRDFSLLMPHNSFASSELLGVAPQLEEIDWNPRTSSLWLPPDVHLDLGGVAKGWAAHQAAKGLASFGPALVNGQGDIAVTAPRTDGSPWQIGISNPFSPQENIAVLHISGGGVATSGRDRRAWMQNGIPVHHIIDPRTGFPAQTDVLTATAIAPTVMQAETVAKTLLILGSENALFWLDAHPEFDALLVLEDGQRLMSENFEKYL